MGSSITSALRCVKNVSCCFQGILAPKSQINGPQRLQNIAMPLILGAPKYTSIQIMSNELYMPEIKVKMNTRTANIIPKITCNQEHSLHESVSIALQQDPKLFKSTMLTLVTPYKNFRPLFYNADRIARLTLAPWQPHTFSTTVYKPFNLKHSFPPEILLEIFNTQLENFEPPHNSIFLYRRLQNEQWRCSRLFFCKHVQNDST